MKADIEFPKVTQVYLAAVQEWSDDFMENKWFAYLINDQEVKIEGIMVVSKAFGTLDGEMKKTSLLRHAYVEIPPQAAIKIEMMTDDVLELNNEFMVTYFQDAKLHDKKYIFKANAINEFATRDLPVLDKKGVLIK
jgi:hypothetical protein